MDADAKPSAVFTAATVPNHWKDEIKAQLDEDVLLAMLENVPAGEPILWHARMHVVPKPDGTPLRTVDLRSLNKSCNVVSLFKKARSVLHNTWKTVKNTWNGYHSIPLAEEERHLTIFIT